MGTWHQFTIGAAERGVRLDLFLKRRLSQEHSRTQIQHVIRLGRVQVDGRPAKVNHLVRTGEAITVQWTATAHPPIPRTLLPEPIPLDVVYEDDALLVVNKPAGLVTHPAPGHWTGTLVNAVLWHLQQAQGSRRKAQGKNQKPTAFSLEPAGPDVDRDPFAHLRPGIVHRLDKDTSGLLLIAKRPEVQWSLQKQLAQRVVRRTYLAVVEGLVRGEQGTIDAPIGRHPKDRKRMAVVTTRGRRAVTHYRVLQRYAARGSRLKAQGKHVEPPASRLQPPAFPCTVLDVTLETGRTHQIRVHLASRGHPVVGDGVYGHAGSGLLLHARALAFLHPVTRQRLELSSPIPSRITQWMATLDSYA